MKNLFIKHLARDERGLSTMEYAVLFVVIVVGAITLWSQLGDDLADNIEKGSETFSTTLEGHQQGEGSGASE
jgi:Flp pilus assembly pilin Flp